MKHLEQALVDQFKAVYQALLGHSPNLVTCHHISPYEVTVMVEGAITMPEKLLSSSGYQELAEAVRLKLNDILRSQLIKSAEHIFQRRVLDLLNDTNYQTGRMSLIIIFASAEENPTLAYTASEQP